MRVNRWVRAGVLAGVAAGLVGVAFAQTLATGDTRTVTEPTFPPTCTALAAQQAMVGGGPASETTFDTSRIQAALTACAAGEAVELTAAGADNMFLIAPITIPSGVSLIVDGGVTVFGSRNPADYQNAEPEACGSYGASGDGCSPLLGFVKNNTNSGLYGYGVIDGRGGSTMLVNGVDSGISWWTNADQADTAGEDQDNPVLLSPNGSTNFTIYKITLRNSPHFNVTWAGTGLTVWGVKIQEPFTAHNTDGIDPKGTNVTITKSSISDGDDEIAVNASSAGANITLSNLTTYSGHGLSVGSDTQNGLTNMLVENINMAGEPTDGNENGIRLKSAADRGGLLQTLTYQNICMRDIEHPLLITPFYDTTPGTEIPSFQNIVFQNVHVLATTGSTKYLVSVEGYDVNHITTMTLDNVVFDQLNTFSPAYSNVTTTLEGNVYPASLQSQTGTNVTYTGSATATATPAYNCSATSTLFPYVVGELYESTATATNLQAATISFGSAITLNAMVQPAKSQSTYNGTVGNYMGAAALTQPVNFYEGSTLVGSAAIGGNGTLASVTLSGVAVGMHTYTAAYPGDTNYDALTFGTVTLTVTGAGVATKTTLIAPLMGTFGGTTTLSATVTGTGGTPSGSVAFYDGTMLLTSGMLNSGSTSVAVTLGGGSHSLTAVYSGDTTFLTSTSGVSTLVLAVAASSTAVAASPTTVSVNATTALTATVTGMSGAAYPTGTISFTDGTTSLGNAPLNSLGVAALTTTLASLGARTITASYGGDGNYAGSNGTAAVQVTASSTVQLTVPATAVYGAATVFSAAVTGAGGTPTGNVTFYDGTTSLGMQTLSGGAASISEKLAGGVHSITAVYAGDSTYLTATSAAAPLTVTPASSGTALSVSPTTVVVDGMATLAATVTGVAGMATPSGTVSFLDAQTSLGVATLNSSGVATLNATLSTPGARAITALYSGDANYAASNGTASETVSSIPTTTTLAVLPATAYVGDSVDLNATVAAPPGYSAPASGTLVFYQGSTAEGVYNVIGNTIYSGVVPTQAGTYTFTAAYGGAGYYAASASAVETLTVVNPVTPTVSPGTIAIAPGNSGTVTLTLAPQAGFVGIVSISCSSPVSYISCTPVSNSVTLVVTSTVTATIAVSATTGSLGASPRGFGPRSGMALAMLAPFGLLGLLAVPRRRRRRRRRRLARVAMAAIAICGAAGMVGCGSSSGAGVSAPSGPQVMTFSVTAGGVNQTAQVTVTIGS